MRKIEIARSIDALGLCKIRNHSVPKENLWNDVMCGECWTMIGIQAGWRLETGPAQAMMIMILKHMGECGNTEDMAMTTKRLTESRSYLALAVRASAGMEPGIFEKCIYCNTSIDEARENLLQFDVALHSAAVAPFWYCKEPKECQVRFAGLFRGQAPDPQQAPPATLVTQ